jgi:hypothetical protein
MRGIEKSQRYLDAFTGLERGGVTTSIFIIAEPLREELHCAEP